MAVELSYRKDQIAQLIAAASRLFDVVRLVDPVAMVVYSIEDGELHEQTDNCFHVWNKTERCENCISARCFMEQARYSKFEFIDNDIYHVVAQPVEIDGDKYVLEVVTASNDNVLLSAFGDNDFVERITSFNHKVYTDELTGLSNRRFLDERFGMIAERAVHAGTPLAVVMVDIDNFKEVNDTRGHLAGDKALAAAARVLREAFAPGSEDIAARYGGDEFLVVLAGISRDELENRLARVKALTAQRELGITFSMGAYYQAPARTLDTKKLILHADRAMYGVKSAQKNGYAIAE